MAALASPPASAAANPIMIMDHEANSSSSFNPETSKMNEKCNRIRDCLQKDQDDDEENEESSYNNSSCNNLWELRELALTEGGLCTGELRQKIWPALVGLRDDQLEETAKLFEPALLCDTVFSEEDDRERDLIRRDVGRSVLFHRNCPSPVSVVSSSAGNNHYPAANDSLLLDNRSATKKHNKNNDPELTTSTLAAVLTATVSAPLTPQQGKPFYYQGLHDIGGVLLQTMDLDEITTTAILRRLCQSHLRDAVRENFADLTWFLDTFLMRVLEKIDPQVHEAIVLSGVPLVSTVMPWLITWFTHCIHEEECASRLLDAFMASHPLLPFYFSVTLMVHPKFRMDIVTAELDDPSSMHFAIQHLPARIGSDWSTTSSAEQDGDCVPAQELIETAISIM